MAAGNVTVYFWFFAIYSAVVSYAFLYHRHEIAMGFKNLFKRKKALGYTDVHNKLMSVYPEVSEWVYLSVLLVAAALGIAGIAAWETYTTPAVVIYGIILCAVAVVPVGIIAAITGLEVVSLRVMPRKADRADFTPPTRQTLNVIAEFIGGSWVAGNALAMNYFKSVSHQRDSHTSDMDFG